jgi:hypothetical protein
MGFQRNYYKVEIVTPSDKYTVHANDVKTLQLKVNRMMEMLEAEADMNNGKTGKQLLNEGRTRSKQHGN